MMMMMLNHFIQTHRAFVSLGIIVLLASFGPLAVSAGNSGSDSASDDSDDPSPRNSPRGGVSVQEIKHYPIENLIRTACSLDSSEDAFLSWNGTVYDVRPGQQAQKIFRVSGFNVARCYPVARYNLGPFSTQGTWFKSSRELMVYLDPDTGDLIDTWTNPFTEEDVAVMHVANSPATFPLGPIGSSLDVLVGGSTGTFELDVPLAYPNPAYFNPFTRPFADYPTYTANEFFKWNVPVVDLDDGTTADGGLRRGTYGNTIEDVSVAWTRQSPYLPWMNMGMGEAANGYLLLSATATKVGGYDDLFPVLKKVVEERAPIYQSAPDCVLGNPAFGTRPGTPPWASVTSWSYFVQNFESYMNGELFPLFEDSDGDAPCIEDVLG